MRTQKSNEPSYPDDWVKGCRRLTQQDVEARCQKKYSQGFRDHSSLSSLFQTAARGSPLMRASITISATAGRWMRWQDSQHQEPPVSLPPVLSSLQG
jgi:hypothetical protein